MVVVPAAELEPATLLHLFNSAYSDYLVPLQLTEEALSEHVSSHDIDLTCSRVVVEGEPASFALIARRDGAGWVGGMGTAPAHRRHGLGERALLAGLDAASVAGCREVWLEVLLENQAAIRLYEKLGFRPVREVAVWSLVPTAEDRPNARVVALAQARAWIAANRSSREPWQRSDETTNAIAERVASLDALVVDRDDEIAAAVVFREQGERVTVLQIAALDDRSATEVLIAVAGDRSLRLANIPIGEPVSRVLAELGGHELARQHEMLLSL